MAALTLNQIVQRIRSLSLSHKQVNSFYFGEVPEFDARQDILYPAIFLEALPGAIDRAAHTKSFNFRLYGFDKVGVSEDTEANETDVLSDMEQVVSDILAIMMKPDYQFDWDISAQASFTLGTEQLNDMVAGAILDFSVSVEWLADSCSAPAIEVTFINEFEMARTRLFSYTATGSEGGSFAIPALTGKPIISVFRAGQYKRPVEVAPTDSEKIQVGTTDLGTGKGIECNGTAVLQSGDTTFPNEKFDFLYYA